MQKLKELAFTLSNTVSTKSLKKLYPTLDFRCKNSWQFVVDELQLRNNTYNNSMTIIDLQAKYNNIITKWYKDGGNDEYYLDECDKVQREIKQLKNNVIYFPIKQVI